MSNNYQSGQSQIIQKSTLVLGLFAIYLIGSHLRLSIYVGGAIVVPMYLMLFSGAVVAFMFFVPIVRRLGVALLLLVIFVVVQPALSGAFDTFAFRNFLGSFQLVGSLIAAISFIYALSIVDKISLRRLLIYMWSLIILLAAMESLGLKPLFDLVRDILYSGSGRLIYSAELRDLALYGTVRTTVFASEPSFLADTLTTLIVMIFFLDPKRGGLKSWFRLGLMIAVSYILSPSFKAVFFLIALFVWQFWPRNIFRLFMMLLVFMVLSSLALIYIEPLSFIIEEVAGNHLTSGSFYGRVVVGPAVSLSALANFPLFGYGIGNENGAYDIIFQAWLNSGALYLFPWFQEMPAKDLMTSGFWWQFIFLGGLGGILFVILILWVFRSLQLEMPLRTLVCTWIVWYSGGAFVDPQSWYMVVVFSVGAMSAPIHQYGTTKHSSFRLDDGDIETSQSDESSHEIISSKEKNRTIKI